MLDAFDLAALPPEVSPGLVQDVVDAFSALGPFGFRGPAARHVPAGLTGQDGPTTTTQVIVPGDACPSQVFLAAAADAVGLLAVSSANRSRHVTGGLDAPVHWRAADLRAELGDTGLVILEHADEAAARARFPRHTTVSTTILAAAPRGAVARARAPGARAARLAARRRRRGRAAHPGPRPHDRRPRDHPPGAARLRPTQRASSSRSAVMISPGASSAMKCPASSVRWSTPGAQARQSAAAS